MDRKNRSPIDRSSYEPAFAQLSSALRKRIATGLYRAGDRLPSERELCQEFGLAPLTVRRAMDKLIDEGVIVGERGRGTFVRGLELGTATFDLRDLRDLLEDDEARARIVEARVVPASPRVARKLNIGEGSRAVSVKRVISRGDKVIVYHAEYLICDPRRPVIEMELGVTALRDLFEAGGSTELAYGELEVHASMLTPSEADYFAEEAGQSAFVIEHRFFDYERRPVSWGRFIWPSSYLHFRTTVGLRPFAHNMPRWWPGGPPARSKRC